MSEANGGALPRKTIAGRTTRAAADRRRCAAFALVAVVDVLVAQAVSDDAEILLGDAELADDVVEARLALQVRV